MTTREWRPKRVYQENRQRQRELKRENEFLEIIKLAYEKYGGVQILTPTSIGIERKKPGMIEEGIKITQLSINEYRISDWKYQDAGGSWSDTIDRDGVIYLLNNW